MANYQKMESRNSSPTRRRPPKAVSHKRKFPWFALILVLYSAAFLTAAWYGLKYLWSYMDAYEKSRPENVVYAYMDGLTREHICDMSQNLIDSVDHNIQSEEEARAYLMEAISGDITFAKKVRESTASRWVLVLKIGEQLIGEFVIEPAEPDEYGFSQWSVSQESFDLSYLIGNSDSVTALNCHSVYANGVKLDESYVVTTDIRFDELKGYYDDYTLPFRQIYEAGPILGPLELTVQDESGNPVVIDESTDPASFLLNYSEQEQQELQTFVDTFVASYVQFAGCANRNRYGNYKELIQYVVEDTDLAERLYDAIYGLRAAQSRGDEIVSIDIKFLYRLEEGTYLCDITYDVDTTGKNGVVRQTTNAKMVVTDIDGELKAQTFSIYS